MPDVLTPTAEPKGGSRSPQAAPAPAVETVALTRRFGSVTAVNSLQVTIAGKQIFGLLGTNGAGKTTVIKMLTTLLPPTSGTASVIGVRRPA